MWFTTSSGRIELQITRRQAESAAHAGQCDADVAGLSAVPAIRRQLSKLDPETVRQELREYGAWDTVELADDRQNLQRLLWLACCDIVEGVGRG